MSIVRCLLCIWAAVAVLAIAVAITCFWLVNHLPAAQGAEYANIYVNAFLIAALTPILAVPALVVVGLFWALVRWLSRLVHRDHLPDPLRTLRSR